MSLVPSGVLRLLPPGAALESPAEALCVPLTSREVVVGRNRGGAGKGESPKLGGGTSIPMKESGPSGKCLMAQGVQGGWTPGLGLAASAKIHLQLV